MAVTSRRRNQCGEPFAGEGGSGAVAQQSFEAAAVLGFEAHGGVQREPTSATPMGDVGGGLGHAPGGAERAQSIGCVLTPGSPGASAVRWKSEADVVDGC